MKLNKIFATFMTIAFAFVIGISSVQTASAQRYLSELRDTNDVKGIAQFAENLANFLELAQKIEDGEKSNFVITKELDKAGKKVKDGAGTFRSNLKGFIATLKNKNQWNDDLDKEFLEILGSRRIKGFFQRNGGRKILTDADGAINSIATDVDTIIANANKLRAANNTSIFMQTAFAPNASARKFSFKCVLLGVGIAVAEYKGMKRTAENLDGFFDKSCGAGANTAT